MVFPEDGLPNNGDGDDGSRVSQIAIDLNSYAAQCAEHYNFASAATALRKCIAMHPKCENFYVSLGGILGDANKIPEAISVLEKCLEMNPRNAKALGNLAMVTAKIDYEKSMEIFARALKFAPRDVGILWNRACVKGSHGDWSVIDQYEHHRTKQAMGVDLFKNCPFPYWNGKDDLNGKTLYVQFDQGIGDRVLYSRFVYYLKRQYPDCTILASGNERTNCLLWGFQAEGICTLLPEKIPFPKADVGVYATELAVFEGITPDHVPPDPGLILRYARPMAKQMPGMPVPVLRALKVGVCWTGNPQMPKNHERSIPFDLIVSLAENPQVALYSLQAGEGAKDIERIGAHGLIHSGFGFGADLEQKSLSYTAARILNLDLVVTCCTSIAHLAGALGVPTLLMLCTDPYWLWTRTGNKTNWYPSVEIFRQTKMYEWNPVIVAVKQRLREKILQEVQ